MENHTIEQVAEAFRRVLSEGSPEGQSERVILIKRIPIICNDIIEIKANIKWIMWLTMGMTAGIGAIALAVVLRIA